MYEIRGNDSPHTLIMKYSSNSLWLFFRPVILSEFVKLKMCISGQLLGKKPHVAEEKIQHLARDDKWQLIHLTDTCNMALIFHSDW